jgi:hypothetical protein
MKKVLHILTLLLAFATYATAQAPWRAKFIIYFLDSANNLVPDTVWFGCDSLGGEGYQEGLDVYYDLPVRKNSVFSIDNKLGIDTPLKKNIIAFETGKHLRIKLKCYGLPVAIVWDSLDFSYSENERFYMSYAEIENNQGVYFDIIHKTFITLYYQPNYYIPGNYYYKDSINIYNALTQTEIDLLVYYTDTSFRIGLNTSYNESDYIYYSNEKLYIQLAGNESGRCKILNHFGVELVNSEVLSQNRDVIDLSDMKSGIYFAIISTPSSRYVKKFIKN